MPRGRRGLAEGRHLETEQRRTGSRGGGAVVRGSWICRLAPDRMGRPGRNPLAAIALLVAGRGSEKGAERVLDLPR
jgi:hypothetical protein